MNRRTSVILAILFSALLEVSAAGQSKWVELGDVSAISKLPNGVELKSGPSAVRVTAYNNSVIRVRVARPPCAISAR